MNAFVQWNYYKKMQEGCQLTFKISLFYNLKSG